MGEAVRKNSFETSRVKEYRENINRRSVEIKPRTAKNQLKESELSAKAKKRIFSLVLMVGIVLISFVLLSAYSSSIAFKNEEMTAENNALKGEVEFLRVKLEGANNVSNIEKKATQKLGMVYPDDSQYVILDEKGKTTKDFASKQKESAFE